jgi:type IV secretion system protein VirB3
MADGGIIQSDRLFLGLTRPAMIGGVSFSFFALNSLISMTGFILTSNFKIFLFSVAFHLFGMVLSKNDAKAVEVFLMKGQKCPTVGCPLNSSINSYDMF